MDSKKESGVSNINSLPDELIINILKYNNVPEILRFGSTCRRFHDILRHETYLWKKKCSVLFPTVVCDLIEKRYNGEWFKEMKHYFQIKQRIYCKLIEVGQTHYWSAASNSIADLRFFFNIVTSHERNLFYAISILQQIIKKGKTFLDRQECIKPFTLTEMFYAGVVLQKYFHTFLSISWIKELQDGDLTPEKVVNFFLQWTDPANLYPDEDVEAEIQFLVGLVNEHLRKNANGGNKVEKKKDVLKGISDVIFKDCRFTVTQTVDLPSLNIPMVIQTRHGSTVAVAAIYLAVAKQCGVTNCELLTIQNQLLIQWKDTEDYKGPTSYTIDLYTGELCPKRLCPIVQSNPRHMTEYNPKMFLKYLYDIFTITAGALNDCHTKNAAHLLDFLFSSSVRYDCVSRINEQNNYPTFWGHSIPSEPLTLDWITPGYLLILTSMSSANDAASIRIRSRCEKRRLGNVKYGVGMICYHTKYFYVCVIRAWDYAADDVNFPTDDLLEMKVNQPYYYVTAADLSERYVPQDNLLELAQPWRLEHLECHIAREFTHFDGFAYALNDSKRFEYPEDENVVEVYRNRFRHLHYYELQKQLELQQHLKEQLKLQVRQQQQELQLQLQQQVEQQNR